MSATELLDRLRLAGVDLWADGERLRYSAPEDALNEDLLLALRQQKPEILRLLGRPADVSSPAHRPAAFRSASRRKVSGSSRNSIQGIPAPTSNSQYG